MLAAAAPSAAELLRLERVAEGVYAALQPADNSQNDCNSVVLINATDVVVVDAPSNRVAVAELIAAVGELTELPITHVVNTHWHSDHTEGNQVYRERLGEAVRIVGHRTLAQDVPVRAGGYLEEQAARLREVIPKAESQLERGLSLGGEPLTDEQKLEQRSGIERARLELARLESSELVPPDVGYERELVLDRGERAIRLLHFVGHTRGDTVIHLPRERVLITGDLLDEMPYVGHGFPGSWIAALDALERLEFDHVIPGHGPVFAGKEQLRLVRSYLSTVVEHARAAVAAERTLEQARATLDLGGFRARLAGDSVPLGRAFDAYAAEAVARAFAEASGATLD